MSKYDIIIIGSGLGGLECGAILSKEGYNVCVLEKNNLFGGCLQSYPKKGQLLDTGIHYVGSFEEGQILHQCFKYFGIIDKLKTQKLDEKSFDQIYYNNRIFNYAMGHDNFTESMVESFPHQRENIKLYVDKVREVGNLIGIDHLKKGNIAANGINYVETSASQLISQITSDIDLQSVLAATSQLYGGLRDTSTFYHHAMIINSYIESAYRFTDGSMQIADELIREIKKNGGSIINNSEVTRIIIENDKVKAVEVNKEEIIETKILISNIHPKLTFQLTDKNNRIKKSYLTRINSLENSYGLFSVQLIMKKDTCSYINKNIFLHAYKDVWYDANNRNRNITNCMISMQASSRDFPYARVVSIITPMYIDELSKWIDTEPNKRGESYLEFKSKKINEILEFAAQHGFDYSKDIEYIHSTTPLSFRDYTGSIDGSAYGIIKNYKKSYVCFISPRTKLENLFLTGQNLNVHGALGVTLTAISTCSYILGEEYLSKKIGNV